MGFVAHSCSDDNCKFIFYILHPHGENYIPINYKENIAFIVKESVFRYKEIPSNKINEGKSGCLSCLLDSKKIPYEKVKHPEKRSILGLINAKWANNLGLLKIVHSPSNRNTIGFSHAVIKFNGNREEQQARRIQFAQLLQYKLDIIE